MRGNLFWFSDEAWAKLEPHLPRNLPGPARELRPADFERHHACAQKRVPVVRLSA